MVKEQKILLIPSATLMSENNTVFSGLPPVMAKLGKYTIIQMLYNQYHNIVDKIYIVAKKKSYIIEQYIRDLNLPIEIIILDELHDLGYTIKYGLNFILSNSNDVGQLYINFADSIINGNISGSNNNVVYYTTSYTNNTWTHFDYDSDNGHINDIIDKYLIEDKFDLSSKYNNIFIGVFSFNKPRNFFELLNDECSINNLYMDSFYRALLSYSKNNYIDFQEVDFWTDIGHADNYYIAKTNVAARSFNTIKIDDKRGIIKKTSNNKEKLINEIKWYLKIPDKLQYLLPRIYNYSLSLYSPYVSMEYYGYDTLHESLLFGNLSEKKWKQIFEKILFSINDMEQYKLYCEKDALYCALDDMYIKKTCSRLEQLRLDNNFKDFFSENIIINDKIYKPLQYYIDILPKIVYEYIIIPFSGNFNIIHGDLCFSNILIESTYNFIRVIDPRGKFGEYDIYGDSRYEIAKLLHTLEGNYDQIIEDMFFLNVNKTKIDFKIKKNLCYVLDIFLDVFKDKLYDLQVIRIIESLLFLSMIPLHNDNINRQYAMLATGIILLEDSVNHLKGELA